MAYRRCISVRAALFARRSSPSLGYFSHDNDRHMPEDQFRLNIHEYLTQRRSFRSDVKIRSWRYCGSVFRGGSGLVEGGLCMNRYMSTSKEDVATVLTDAPTEAVASQVPAAMSEVAIAAADSAFPVAALQYFIDGVHSITGLNWWASIALSTMLFRGATIPFLIYQFKTMAKIMLQDPSARPNMMSMLKARGGMTPFMTWLIQIILSLDFYLAITNMAEKVPSFKNGGAFWFTDLTTPDATYILPVLTALTFWARRLVLRPKLQPVRDDVKVLFFGAIVLSLNLPQAIHCEWITSNIFYGCFRYSLRFPGVRKALGYTREQILGRARKP